MIEMKQDIDGVTIKCDNSDNMYELIKGIKEKIQILIDKYNVQDISIYIDEGNDINHITVPKRTKDVYVDVRM